MVVVTSWGETWGIIRILLITLEGPLGLLLSYKGSCKIERGAV